MTNLIQDLTEHKERKAGKALTRIAEIPESRCDFVPETAGGELVMRQKCPEIHWGKAPPCGQSACGGEDTEGPAIKIMSKIKIKTERDFANEFRVQEQSKEEALAFREDAETGRPGDAERMGQSNESSVIGNQSVAGESVALGADAGSGGGRSERPGLATGGTPPFDQSDCDGDAAQQNAEIRGQRSERMTEMPESRSDFVAQAAGDELVKPRDCPGLDQRAEIRGQRSEKPELGRQFVPQDIGGEAAMPQDCPEIGRGGGGLGGGVKAVEGYRTPNPGGTTERPRADEHSRGLRRGVSEVDVGSVETW